MHKDWKQMFAAALSGTVCRDDANETAIVNAARIADLACAEIKRREGVTITVHFTETGHIARGPDFEKFSLLAKKFFEEELGAAEPVKE